MLPGEAEEPFLRIDFSAAEAFIRYLAGEETGEHLLIHPAYRAVREHARLAYGMELKPDDLEVAVAGGDSPFFGLRNVRQHLPLLQDFIAAARGLAPGWIADCEESLAQLAGPDALNSLVVYPIVGYDAGIGLAGVACLNINWPVYLGDPAQFGYMAIHECCHVLYGRTRPMPCLATIKTPRQWYAMFSRMTQDEGFAVYTPLGLRKARGAMGSMAHPVLLDYAVLSDDAAIAEHIARFQTAERTLANLRAKPLQREEYLELIFGPARLTYRVGCEIIRRIERTGGKDAVRWAFEVPGEEYLATVAGLAGIIPGSF